ncbi:eca882d0-d8e2-4fb9-a919-aeebf9b3210a [Thermothielavioides terrestris]|uniref:Eca882d0-d8e2-4fb9-a919-aeebf9b3210a n=1 Tax=Thermothielavioides terrestris TaxID=2587410 RepID=A0A446BVA9_9PEZI|nr:eca882d0-d8e2-4fb9-a919-aeebf9b3210a [Thermothielavioides terrestris]
MGLQLEPISQSLEQYGPWRFGDIRHQEDPRAELEAALLQTAAIPGLADTLREISQASITDRTGPARAEATRPLPKVPRSGSSSPGSPAAPAPAAGPSKTSRPLFPRTLDPSLAFTRIVPSGADVVTFPLRPAPHERPKPCLKRRRPDTDVDGHNTASLGCKKRRLLRNLVTSRLSQPFSLPATHILNREAVATGETRFLKLAAIMSARRLNSAVAVHSPAPSQQQPSPSTWLRRAAVINRLRSRVCAEAAERGHVYAADLAVKAAVFQQGGQHGTTTASLGGRYLVYSSSHGPSAEQQQQEEGEEEERPVLDRAFSTTSTSSSSTTTTTTTTATTTTTTTTTCLRIPSPRLRPLRSPELRVTRPLVPLEEVVDDLLDGADEAGYVAFPTSEHESRYEDEPEEVPAAAAALSLPPISALPTLPTAAQTAALDLLFEPSPALHALALPTLRAAAFASYPDLIAAVRTQLLALADTAASAADADADADADIPTGTDADTDTTGQLKTEAGDDDGDQLKNSAQAKAKKAKADLYAILGSHPRLGERSHGGKTKTEDAAAGAGTTMSALSREEQRHLRDGADGEGAAAAELARLNAAYEARFPGLRYVVWAMCDIAADRARKLLQKEEAAKGGS